MCSPSKKKFKNSAPDIFRKAKIHYMNFWCTPANTPIWVKFPRRKISPGGIMPPHIETCLGRECYRGCASTAQSNTHFTTFNEVSRG